MIDVYRDDDEHFHASKRPSIISHIESYMTDVGYKVLISLKTQNFTITSDFSRALNGSTQKMIFKDDKGNSHFVEWEVPAGCDRDMVGFHKTYHDEVVIYFIKYEYLMMTKLIESYECPSEKLMRTFKKLTT